MELEYFQLSKDKYALIDALNFTSIGSVSNYQKQSRSYKDYMHPHHLLIVAMVKKHGQLRHLSLWGTEDVNRVTSVNRFVLEWTK